MANKLLISFASLVLFLATSAPSWAQPDEQKPTETAEPKERILSESYFILANVGEKTYQLRLLYQGEPIWQLPARIASDISEFHYRVEDLNIALFHNSLKILFLTNESGSQELWLSTWFKKKWFSLPRSSNSFSLANFFQSLNWSSHPGLRWNQIRPLRERVLHLQKLRKNCLAEGEESPLPLSPSVSSKSDIEGLKNHYRKLETLLLPLAQACTQRK